MTRQATEQQESREAFEDAIFDGVLSANEAAPNYAGRYMWMGVQKRANGHFDAFKNIDTRQYIFGNTRV